MYKRQPPAPGTHGTGGGERGAVGRGVGTALAAPRAHCSVSRNDRRGTEDGRRRTLDEGPVSYTHLDVYKRQQRDGAAKRKAAEVELGKIEGELKQKLMELHN